MKTKIKNDFQNPDLIFGNENENQKWKLIFIFEKAIDKQKSIWYIDYRNKKTKSKRRIVWEL